MEFVNGSVGRQWFNLHGRAFEKTGAVSIRTGLCERGGHDRELRRTSYTLLLRTSKFSGHEHNEVAKCRSNRR